MKISDRLFELEPSIELLQLGRDPLPYSDPFEHLLHRIQDYPGPVIAMIEGTVWGEGV